MDKVAGAVDAILAEFFERQELAVGFEVLREFVLGGGKRMRPLFAWAGYQGAGGEEDPDAVLRAVSSLELIQACALIHDDIIDSSDMRRGAPTVHIRLESWHREQGWAGDSAQYGRSAAILLGDVALAWAEDMLHSSGVSEAALRRALVPWRAMRTEVISGQLLDITVEAARDERASEAERVNRLKTAAYTIERPLHIGAALAGASDEVIEAYRGFGTDIGVAYQLRDDILGVFGQPEVTGKPAGDDIVQGKRTVLVAETLRRVSDPDAQLLRRSLGTAADVDRIASMMEDSGARAEVERRIDQLTASGLAHLERAPIDPQVKTTLRDLATQATTRNR